MAWKDIEKRRAYLRAYNKKNRHKWDMQKWRDEHPERVKEIRARHLQKMRAQAFKAYGSSCACCGETEEAFLTFDHILGGGHKERAQHGSDYLRILKKMGYPPTIQILCANCNMAKFTRGVCPHQKFKIRSIGGE